MMFMRTDGRFGNNMFQYAAIRSVAEHKGCEFALIPNKTTDTIKMLRFFNIKCNVLSRRTSNHIFHSFNDDHYYNPSFWESKDGTMFTGYYQSEKYFDHDKVRQWFAFNKQDGLGDDLCLIHFRGGDYGRYPWNTFQLPPSYYQEAMSYMRGINPCCSFLVVTDDVEQAKKYFNDIDIVSHSSARDFTMLSSAKYLIISNSSFSWWAAWLNKDNTVVAPSGWLIYQHRNGEYSPKDIKVDRWIWI